MSPEGGSAKPWGALNPFPARGVAPDRSGRVGRDGRGDWNGCLHVSPDPLCLSFPTEPQAGQEGDGDTLTLGGAAGKSPPAALCPTGTPRDRDTAPSGGRSPRGYGQGTSTGTRDPQNLCAGAPPLPPAIVSPGCAGGRGPCPMPGCPGSAPAPGGFPGGQFHQTQSFPLGKWGLGVVPPPAQPPAWAPLSTGAQHCLCRALPWPCQEGPGHPGHRSQPCRRGGTARGSPCRGTGGSPAAGSVAPIPSRGILARGWGGGGGAGAEEAAAEEE